MKIVDTIPDGLIDCTPNDLYKILPGLSLIHLQGKNEPALFLSCLIHGNELTGFEVVQALMKKYGAHDWPRSVYLLFGNVTAAKEGLRHLEGQPDFNRIWLKGEGPESERASAILKKMGGIELFASIDIHNNTGRNPLFSVVTENAPRHFNLACQFEPLCMYFGDKQGTVTENFTSFCPSVTIEAGLSGEFGTKERVLGFVERLMPMPEIHQKPISELNMTVLDTVGTVKVPSEATVGIGAEEGDFVFESDLDRLNFKEVSKGSLLGFYHSLHRLQLIDLSGSDIAEDYFDYQDGKILARKEMYPAMITPHKTIIKSDCLCYVMKTMNSED